MSEFIHVEPVRYWCHKILPLVYDDSLSYMELLNKVVYKLNEVVNNNNELPAYIAEQIKNYINSGEISKVVQDILANYSLNVKFPPEGITPAVGDGTADDTAAFQGCLDYAHAHGGMMVFVPAGKYLCGNLTMYSGCSIKGDGRYDTTIVMRGGVSNPFIGGELDAIQIADIGIDGNADIQVNNVDVFNVKLSNALLTNLFITDGYTLLKIQENGGDIQIDNIVFDKCVVRAVDLIKGVSSRVQMSQVVCRNVSKLNGESAIRIGTDGGFYDNIISVANAPIGIEVTGSNNYVVGTVVNAVDSCKDTGENNNIKIVGEEENYTISGNYTFKTNGDRVVHVDGVDSVNVGSQNVEVNGNSTLKTNSIFIDTKTPIKYSKPTPYNDSFSVVNMTDINGENYELLVKGPKIDDVGNQFITFKQFGAVGDGVHDDTTAIKNAIAEAKLKGKGIYVDSGEYLISDEILIDCEKSNGEWGSCYFVCYGTIIQTVNKTALHFKHANNGTIQCNIKSNSYNGGYLYPTTNETYNDLTMIGLKLDECYSCNVTGKYINLHVGVRLYGNAHGCCFNNISVSVDDCVIGIDYFSEQDGWVNSNYAFSCYCHNTSDNQHYLDNIAIRLYGAGNNSTNCNVFNNTILEMRGRGVWISNGQFNKFDNCRCESKTSPYFLYVESGILNSMSNLYGQLSVPKLGDNAQSAIQFVQNLTTQEISNFKIFDKWDYDKNKMCLTASTSGSAYAVHDSVSVVSYYDYTKQDYLYRNGADSISEIGWASANVYIGKFIKLNGCTSIAVKLLSDGNGVRPHAVFYDNDWNIVNPARDVNYINFVPYGFGSAYHGQEIRGEKQTTISQIYAMKILDENIKYVFIGGGADGGNITGMEFLYRTTGMYEGCPTVVTTKNYYSMPIYANHANVISYADVGFRVNNNNMEQQTDSTGNYVIPFYIATEKTEKTLTMKPMKLYV